MFYKTVNLSSGMHWAFVVSWNGKRTYTVDFKNLFRSIFPSRLPIENSRPLCSLYTHEIFDWKEGRLQLLRQIFYKTVDLSSGMHWAFVVSWNGKRTYTVDFKNLFRSIFPSRLPIENSRPLCSLYTHEIFDWKEGRLQLLRQIFYKTVDLSSGMHWAFVVSWNGKHTYTVDFKKQFWMILPSHLPIENSRPIFSLYTHEIFDWKEGQLLFCRLLSRHFSLSQELLPHPIQGTHDIFQGGAKIPISVCDTNLIT